ncbi:AraC family transcriptional regulator [Actinoplanes sp. OR16]|uniref:AraC family transcriptional regulator n=1 Tax=Actinoplanes sp. OR16 TaxID=946334 RepID=UPI000F6EBFEE|nr:AraC family transcriptional regulator [Actinoplanes sp. OR16]BBH70998.1 AraC family transcriptional regulator [Actinoplanes sp. OR16]
MTLAIRDVDHARQLLNDHFYTMDVDVLATRPEWTATFAVGGDDAVTVGDLQFGMDVAVRAGELGAYHVNMPLTGRMVFRQGNDDVTLATPESAGVYRPTGDTVVDHWAGDCRIVAVKIARAELENQLARILDAPIRGPIDLDPGLDLTRGAGAAWGRLARMIAADTSEAGLTLHPVVGARLRETLVSGLLTATGHRYRDAMERHRPALAAPGAIRRVVEAMRAQPGRPFTVADLAGIAGVGVRSLQQSFQRYVGMPPMTYLRQLRLGLVHDELRQALPGTTVAQVAYRYGFTHPSRFAAAYRQRYGAAPSDTLRS